MYFALPGSGYNKAKKEVGELFPQVRYLQDTMGFPVYDHSVVRYFSPGEALFKELLSALEKAERYIFGFIHAKTFVCDDRVATVGTTNLDFRSLYLHFKCGALLFNTTAIMDIKKNFIHTLGICHQITQRDCSRNFLLYLFQDFLRLFAPLM